MVWSQCRNNHLKVTQLLTRAVSSPRVCLPTSSLILPTQPARTTNLMIRTSRGSLTLSTSSRTCSFQTGRKSSGETLRISTSLFGWGQLAFLTSASFTARSMTTCQKANTKLPFRTPMMWARSLEASTSYSQRLTPLAVPTTSSPSAISWSAPSALCSALFSSSPTLAGSRQRTLLSKSMHPGTPFEHQIGFQCWHDNNLIHAKIIFTKFKSSSKRLSLC